MFGSGGVGVVTVPTVPATVPDVSAIQLPADGNARSQMPPAAEVIDAPDVLLLTVPVIVMAGVVEPVQSTTQMSSAVHEEASGSVRVRPVAVTQ